MNIKKFAEWQVIAKCTDGDVLISKDGWALFTTDELEKIVADHKDMGTEIEVRRVGVGVPEIKQVVLFGAAVELAEECVATSEFAEWMDENGEMSISAMGDYVAEYYAAINDYDEPDKDEYYYMLSVFCDALYKTLTK